jgi:transcriptional regulator with XRE-family HTH domain
MTEAGVSFRNLARATGVSAGYLNHLVHAKRPPPAAEVLGRIAAAVNVDSAHFLEYRWQCVSDALGKRPWVVNRLFFDMGLAEPDTSPGLLSDLSFGASVRLAMRTAGLSYRELADRTRLSAGYLHHLTYGRRSTPEPDVIEQIAEALRTQPHFFFDYRLASVIDALRQRPALVNDLFLELCT